MAKETAEQKLLKIIENTEAKQASPSPASSSNVAQEVANSVKGSGVSMAMPPAVASLFSFLKKQDPSQKQAIAFGLKEFNQILIVAVVVVLIFFVMDFSNGLKSVNRELEVPFARPLSDLNENIIPEPKSVDDYLVVVERRNIFQPFEKKEAEEKMALVPKETRRVVEQTKDLKLVGISWLDTPESASALIENTQSGMTYFLRAGDKVNEVTVLKIFADCVIVNFEGEDLKLNL